MTLFIVKMNRWGDEESHSYVEGVYQTLFAAEAAGQREQVRRGGKYEPVIEEFSLDQSRSERESIKTGPRPRRL